MTLSHPLVRAFIEVLRYLGVLLPGFIALFLIVRAFVDGNVSDMTYALWLLVIFAATLLIKVQPFENRQAKRAYLIRLAVILVPIALIVPLTVVVMIFGKTDMAAFMFHLVFGVDGTPPSEMAPFVFTVLVFWGVIVATLYRMHHWVGRIPMWWAIISVAILAGNPLVYDVLYNRASAEYGSTPSLTEYFVEPAIIAPDVGEKPDLIVVYLEGLEATYGEDVFGGIFDPIKVLAAEGIALENVQQAFGTGWSLGGTVATQCGVALLPQGARPTSRMSEIQWILPEVTCLPDVLHARGYHQTYIASHKIVGSKMGFYGFDNYFTTHNVDRIIDSENAMTPGAVAERAAGQKGWGLRDQELYEIGIDHVKRRLESDQPYAMYIATMDTHGPTAFVSQACRGPNDPAEAESFGETVACSTKLTLDFVRRVQAMTKGRPTRIVLTSDHLAHHNTLSSELNRHERRNVVILLNGPTPPREVSTDAIMPDLFPTILDWMGLSKGATVRAGIGVSLLGDPATVTHELGLEEVDRRLKVDVKLARFIWRQSQADD